MTDQGTSTGALFQPSLSPEAPARPLYSVQAGFFVSFLGGVYGASLFTAVNSRRMNRLASDWWLPAAAALLWSAFLLWTGSRIASSSLPAWLDFLPGGKGSTVRRLGMLAGLLTLGAHYLRRKTAYRAQDLSGVPAPTPWRLGIAAVALAALLSFAMIAAGERAAG